MPSSAPTRPAQAVVAVLPDDSVMVVRGAALAWVVPARLGGADSPRVFDFGLPESGLVVGSGEAWRVAQPQKYPRLASQLALHYSNSFIACAASPPGFGPLRRCCAIVLGSNGYVGVLAIDGKRVVELDVLTNYALPVESSKANAHGKQVPFGSLRPVAVAVAQGVVKTTLAVGVESHSCIAALATRTPHGHVALFSVAAESGRALLVGGFDLGHDLHGTSLAFSPQFRLAVGDSAGSVSLWDLSQSPTSLLLRGRLVHTVHFDSVPRPVTCLAWHGDGLLGLARGPQLAVIAPKPQKPSQTGAPGVPSVETRQLNEPPPNSSFALGIAWLWRESGREALVARTEKGLMAYRVLLPSCALQSVPATDVLEGIDKNEPWIAACGSSPLRLSLCVVDEAMNVRYCPSQTNPSWRLQFVVDAAKRRGYCLASDLVGLVLDSSEPWTSATQADFWSEVVRCGATRTVSERLRRAALRVHARNILREASDGLNLEAARAWISFLENDVLVQEIHDDDSLGAPSLDSLRRLTETVKQILSASSLPPPASERGEMEESVQRRCAWSRLPIIVRLRDVEGYSGVDECTICHSQILRGLNFGLRGEALLPVVPFCPLCCVAV